MVLAGQKALVTGASRGIGRGIAIGLAQAGADVAINYKGSDPKEADETATEVRKTGRRAIICAADVSDYDAVERMVERAAFEFGRLDIAVGSAAYSDREPFTEADLAGFRRTVDVTMWGTFNLMRAAARRMIEQGVNEQGHGGSIKVLIGSAQGFIPVPGAMAYNMSKAAVHHAARIAAIELIDHRIRVNLIYPGWIDTPGERKFSTEEQIAASSSKLPWKRLGRPDEVARGVVFVCDPASDYMTGSEILIDGGITLPWWARNGMGVPQ